MKPNANSLSEQLRRHSINVHEKRVLITNYLGSDQEKDLVISPNCNGYGRIHHFRKVGTQGWPPNPLPMDPASAKLRKTPENVLLAQLFQNAVCNWRCWYCYVPYKLLGANSECGAWLSAADLMDLYQKEPAPASVIDLTGGQPDLTPEWIPWIMQELKNRHLEDKVYLWSDDNMSTDFFWRYLSKEQIDAIRSYPNYGKVCCFKGFSDSSFAFNTGADPKSFHQQLELFKKFTELGIDLYGYVTLTTHRKDALESDISQFVDRLQAIRPNLPLRIIPIEIKLFTPTKQRMRVEHQRAIQLQWDAVGYWMAEIKKRFDLPLRTLPIHEVPI